MAVSEGIEQTGASLRVKAAGGVACAASPILEESAQVQATDDLGITHRSGETAVGVIGGALAHHVIDGSHAAFLSCGLPRRSASIEFLIVNEEALRCRRGQWRAEKLAPCLFKMRASRRWILGQDGLHARIETFH